MPRVEYCRLGVMAMSSDDQPTESKTLSTAATATLVAIVLFALLETLRLQRDQEIACRIAFNSCPLSLLAAANQLIRNAGQWLPQFVGLALVGVAAASFRRGNLFWLPAATFVLWPYLLGAPASSIASFSWPTQFLGVASESALSLVPAAIIADRRQNHSRDERLGWDQAYALLFCVGAFVVFTWVWIVRGNHSVTDGGATLLYECFLLGLILSRTRTWAFVGCIAVPILITEGNFGGWFWTNPSGWKSVIPFIGVAFLGAIRHPFDTWIKHLDTHPFQSFVALQSLNVADALLTALGLHQGSITEANPAARFIGMPLKIVLGGVAGWLLYRWRPRLLLIPIVVLAGVVVYHVGGLVVNAH